jgi:hypothetical protein
MVKLSLAPSGHDPQTNLIERRDSRHVHAAPVAGKWRLGDLRSLTSTPQIIEAQAIFLALRLNRLPQEKIQLKDCRDRYRAPSRRLLSLHGKSQEHISGHAAPLAITGVDEDHAIDDCRACDVHRAASCGFVVDRRKGARRIGIP